MWMTGGKRVRCEGLVDALALAADGSELADRRARRHVEACLRCQAELIQYRKLVRALRSLRADVLVPAPGLVDDVLATLEAAGERHALRSLMLGRRAAYGGLAVATAAAGAGAALVLVNRSRRARAA